MVWMGFLGYFFIASVLFLIFQKFTDGFSKVFGLALFGVAIVLGIYGLIHANRIIVKKVNIKLERLPEIWRGKKAVWISDLHLGQIYGIKIYRQGGQKNTKYFARYSFYRRGYI